MGGYLENAFDGYVGNASKASLLVNGLREPHYHLEVLSFRLICRTINGRPYMSVPREWTTTYGWMFGKRLWWICRKRF